MVKPTKTAFVVMSLVFLVFIISLAYAAPPQKDTDSDGKPDPQDWDDDNDFVPDSIEILLGTSHKNPESAPLLTFLLIVLGSIVLVLSPLFWYLRHSADRPRTVALPDKRLYKPVPKEDPSAKKVKHTKTDYPKPLTHVQSAAIRLDQAESEKPYKNSIEKIVSLKEAIKKTKQNFTEDAFAQPDTHKKPGSENYIYVEDTGLSLNELVHKKIKHKLKKESAVFHTLSKLNKKH